jgi:hypothetical protein
MIPICCVVTICSGLVYRDGLGINELRFLLHCCKRLAALLASLSKSSRLQTEVTPAPGS